MTIIALPGVLKKQDRLFTENLKSAIGTQLYNEKLVTINGIEYRSWNPFRSKLAAVLLKGTQHINISSDSQILYLGAATGTTVSHLSDIAKHGTIYAVENSPISMKKLLEMCGKRKNVIPILADANHPDRYHTFVPQVDFLYQDISQRNQAEIFIKNRKQFLKTQCQGILMVKTRSIDVSLKPRQAYERVAQELREKGLLIQGIVDLAPFEKDHAAIIVSNPG